MGNETRNLFATLNCGEIIIFSFDVLRCCFAWQNEMPTACQIQIFGTAPYVWTTSPHNASGGINFFLVSGAVPRAKKRERKSEKQTTNRSFSESKLSQAEYANQLVVSRITRFHLDVLTVPRASWIRDWAAWGTCGNGTLARLRQPHIRQRFKRRETYGG